MSLIRAFPGLRPDSAHAAAVAAPPYDVLTEAEARRMVEGRPWSFLHISRPEVDLPPGSDPYSAAAYAMAARNLAAMRSTGVLRQDTGDGLYAYRLTRAGHVQLGLMATASVAAYDQGRIKKHELTRPVKEDDRVRQIEALQAQTGPVFLAYPADLLVDGLLAKVAEAPADINVTLDAVRHELWVVADPEHQRALTGAFDAMPALYVADGHHRAAAASRVAAARRANAADGLTDLPSDYFLAALFPHDQVQILDYNRVVRDLNGLSGEDFLRRIAEYFEVTLSPTPVRPELVREFGMYMAGQWYRLRLDSVRVPLGDPVASLDVSLLLDLLLSPLLGIGDPRHDQRIDFVGGARGLQGLSERIDSGEMAVGFSLFPTRMESLMAVADSGGLMPPKSTWFEPKLADGLVSHLI
jgi:uncharacterized protein (DUF1015 family)